MGPKSWQMKKSIPVILNVLMAILTLFIIYCSSSVPSGSDHDKPQDVVKTLILSPGLASSIVFSDRFEINFPVDAVSSSTEIEAREINTEANASLYASADLLSPAYIMTPHDMILNKPARVEFDLSYIQLPDGLPSDSLEIYTYNGETFEGQNAWVEDDHLVCDLHHFSLIYMRTKAGVRSKEYILETGFNVYKQQEYLCFSNIFGSLTVHPLKAIWVLASTPTQIQLVYQVSLYESTAIGFNKLVSAKQSCRICWDNPGIAYEAYWSPGKYNEYASYVNQGISYDSYPSICYQLRKSGSLDLVGSYGDETVISYNASKEKTGAEEQKIREIDTTLNAVQYLSDVFISDDMRRFIPLTELDENKEYCIEVTVHFSDWMFGSSDSRKFDVFKLKDVPVEELPNQAPTASISNPSANATFTQLQVITFAGSGTDPEDGTLGGSSLVWTSDRDGNIGTGGIFAKSNLSAGLHRITLTATDGDGLIGTAIVSISVQPSNQRVISVPSSLNFSSVPVGSSVDQTLTVQNTGKEALQVLNITLTNRQFTLVSGSTNFSLQPGSSSSVIVRFTPGSAGAKSGVLRITNNSPVNPKEVSLNGTGIAAAMPVIFVPSSLDFGSVSVGSSADQILTIQNTGNTSLQVSNITLSNGQFTLVSVGTNFIIQAGSSRNLTLRFTPNSAGSQSGVLSVFNNSQVNPREVILIGIGEANTQQGETGTMTDQNDNIYRTVKIDSLWWMIENLKVIHYRNGWQLSPQYTLQQSY